MVLETVKSLLQTEDGTVEYIYGLTEKKMNINSKRVTVYGVSAKSIITRNNKKIAGFADKYECISPDRNKTMELIKMLRDNMVSPIHLADIIEPEIDDYYKLFN